MIFFDNLDSDQDGCSDLEDDCVLTTLEDSLLDDSVTCARISTPAEAKRGREDDHPLITRRVVPNPVGTQEAGTRYTIPRVSPTPEPVAGSSASSFTITTSDGTLFHIGDFMKDVMKQMKTTYKVLSKDEESETTKRLRLAEAEASFVHYQFDYLLSLLE